MWPTDEGDLCLLWLMSSTLPFSPIKSDIYISLSLGLWCRKDEVKAVFLRADPWLTNPKGRVDDIHLSVTQYWWFCKREEAWFPLSLSGRIIFPRRRPYSELSKRKKDTMFVYVFLPSLQLFDPSQDGKGTSIVAVTIHWKSLTLKCRAQVGTMSHNEDPQALWAQSLRQWKRSTLVGLSSWKVYLHMSGSNTGLPLRTLYLC